MVSACNAWVACLPDRETTRLRTLRCELRCVTEADAHALFAAARSPEFARWLSWDAPSSVEPLVERFRQQRRAWYAGDTFSFSAHALSSDVVVGGVELKPDPLQPRRGCLNVGYWIHPEHQGKGLATELVAAVVQFGFSLGCDEIVAGVGLENAASHRVLQKLGFIEFERAERCSPSKAFPNVRYRLAASATSNASEPRARATAREPRAATSASDAEQRTSSCGGLAADEEPTRSGRRVLH